MISIGVTLLIWAIKHVSAASNIVSDTYLQIRIDSSLRWRCHDPQWWYSSRMYKTTNGVVRRIDKLNKLSNNLPSNNSLQCFRNLYVTRGHCDWTNSMEPRDNFAGIEPSLSIRPLQAAVSWDATACDFMFTLGDLAATVLQATVTHVASSSVA